MDGSSQGRLFWRATSAVKRTPNRLRARIEERRLSPEARAVRDARLTYLSAARLNRLEEAFNQVIDRQVEGDIIEFGVALGGSSILLARQTKPPRRFIGLDVFATIPPPGSAYDGAKARERYASIAAGKATGLGGDEYYGYRSDLYSYVVDQFRAFGLTVDGDHIQLHRGTFEESWPQLSIDQVAFAHIDCDWYEPVRYGLGAVAPRQSPGSVIVVDDYHDYDGCHAAVDQFLAAWPQYAVEDGGNLILRRSSR